MKAYVYGANGAEITEVAKPSAKGAQVLVRVRACGLNRADLGMTKGHAHGSAGGAGTVLGMEWAGEIAEVGPDARGIKSATGSWVRAAPPSQNIRWPTTAGCSAHRQT